MRNTGGLVAREGVGLGIGVNAPADGREECIADGILAA